MKKKHILSINWLHAIVLSVAMLAASTIWGIPLKPTPPRLINDFVGILSHSAKNIMEKRVVAFADSTSTQICVVIVPTLDGQDKAEYAYEIGSQWGVGDKEFNNGIVMLVVPKTNTQRGEIFIATGYGAEGALPDALTKTIIENQIIPNFQRNDYETGIYTGIEYIIAAMNGEYDKKLSQSNAGSFNLIIIWALLITLVIVVILLKGNKNNGENIGGNKSNHSGLPLWLLFSLLSNSSGRGGSHGGGGFGGFGGGRFGGGGAGGSW